MIANKMVVTAVVADIVAVAIVLQVAVISEMAMLYQQ